MEKLSFDRIFQRFFAWWRIYAGTFDFSKILIFKYLRSRR